MSPRERRLKLEELRLRRAELANRQWEAKYKSKGESFENGVKGLLYVNGGAAVALGALLQALVAKPEVAALLPYILWGIVGNVLGVAVASFVFVFRYLQWRLEARERRFMESNLWWWCVWIATFLSVVAFVGGVGYATWGGLIHLSPRHFDLGPV